MNISCLRIALRTKRGAATAYLHSAPDPAVYVLVHFQLSFLTPPQGSRCSHTWAQTLSFHSDVATLQLKLLSRLMFLL